MSMKISTALLFDRATDRMSKLQNRLAHTQAQMAATKQVLSPSDAPDQAAVIQRLRGEVDRQDSHAATLKVAMNRYAAEETALTGANDILLRVKDLAIQAANDTVGSDDREAIAAEMQALRNQLVSLGNSKDDAGNYLFSGTRVNTPAFAEDEAGYVIYQGDQTQTRIPAGVERTVAFTRAGTDVFTRVTRQDERGDVTSVSFFESLDDLVAALRGNSGADIRKGLGEVDQMMSGVNVALAQTGADQQVVQSQMDVLDETALRLKSTLSDVEDLDYTTAVTQMNKELTALEAAMSSFGKISGLSLFDYVQP